MKDRIPTQVLANGAIRYEKFDGAGNSLGYEWIKRADEPAEIGTPTNKASLLTDATAALLKLTQSDPTVNDAFNGLHKISPVYKGDLATLGYTTLASVTEPGIYYIFCAHWYLTDYPQTLLDEGQVYAILEVANTGQGDYISKTLTASNAARTLHSRSYAFGNTWVRAYDKDYKPFVTGTYTGDWEPSQFINLGFTPSAVFVEYDAHNLVEVSTVTTYWGGYAFTGFPFQIGTNTLLEIVTNGFRAYYLNGPNPLIALNVQPNVYKYIAYR